MDWGNKLREQRESQGFTLDDVEQETKIRKIYIKAIEEEQFSMLPPRVYATGFVKRYARFLKIDENEMVEQFKALAYADDEVEEEHHNYSAPILSGERTKKTPFNIRNLAAAITFMIIVVWLGNMVVGYLANRGSQSAEHDKAQVVEHRSPSTTQKPSTVSSNWAKVEITANQKCWVQIKADDVVQFEGTMQASEQKSFKGNSKVYIHAGNAGGLSVKLNDKDVQTLGAIGEVVEYELLKDGTIRKL